MLFGTKAIREMIEKDVRIIEQKYNISVIFGAAVSSLERGITKYSTDYDIRFLFFRNDQIFLQQNLWHDYESMRIREYYETDERPYEYIELWEISAFFNMAIEPYISQGYNHLLSQIVFETIFSPYVYDPLGIVAKIAPYAKKMFSVRNEKISLYQKTKQFLAKTNFQLIEALNGFYEYMRLKWLVEKGEIPPIYYFTLLQNEVNKKVFDDLYQEVEKWNEQQYKGEYRQKDITIARPEELIEVIEDYISKICVEDEYNFDITEEQRSAHGCVQRIVENAILDRNRRYFFMENINEKDNC